MSDDTDDNDVRDEQESQERFLLVALRRPSTLFHVLRESNYTAMLKMRLLNSTLNALITELNDYWNDKIHRCIHPIADIDADKYAQSVVDVASSAKDGDDWTTTVSGGTKRDKRALKAKVKKEIDENDPMLARKKRFVLFKMIEQTMKQTSMLEPSATPFERFVAMMVVYNLYTSTETDAQRRTYRRSKQLKVVDLDKIAFYTVHRRDSSTTRVDMNEGYAIGADDDDDDDDNDDGHTHKIVLRVVKKLHGCVIVLPLYAYTSAEAYKRSIERNKCLYSERSDTIASFEFSASGHSHSSVIADHGSEAAFRAEIKYFVRIDPKLVASGTERLLQFPYNIIKCKKASLGFATVIEAPDAQTLQAEKRATERDYRERKKKSSSGKYEYLVVDPNCYANAVRFAEYTPSAVVNVDNFWHALAILVYDEELDRKQRMVFPNQKSLCVLIDRYADDGGGGGKKTRKLITGLLGMANTGHLFDAQRNQRVEAIGDFSAYQLVVKNIVSTESDLYASVNQFHEGKAAVERCIGQAEHNRKYFGDLVDELPVDSPLRAELAAIVASLNEALAFEAPYQRLLQAFNEHESSVFASFVE